MIWLFKIIKGRRKSMSKKKKRTKNMSGDMYTADRATEMLNAILSYELDNDITSDN